MTFPVRLGFALLRSLLALYPARYRREYGEERTHVLQLALEDASKRGWLGVLQFCARECRDLPWALLREHYKEWMFRMNSIERSAPLPGRGLSGRQILFFLIPFLPILLISLANWFKVILSPIPIWVLLAAALLLGIIGLVKGLPGWALPSIGLGLSVLRLMVLVQQVVKMPVISQLYAALWTDFMLQRILYVLILSLLTWMPVMFLLVVLALLAIWLRGLSALREHLERDWTLLPFLLFATNLLTPFYADAYRGLEPYQLLFTLVLMGGAWYYMWTSQPQHRLIGLLLATLLSGLVLALGIYQIYPLQKWVNDSSPNFPRWWETINPLLDMLALIASLGAMAAFGKLIQLFERPKIVTA